MKLTPVCILNLVILCSTCMGQDRDVPSIQNLEINTQSLNKKPQNQLKESDTNKPFNTLEAIENRRKQSLKKQRIAAHIILLTVIILGSLSAAPYRRNLKPLLKHSELIALWVGICLFCSIWFLRAYHEPGEIFPWLYASGANQKYARMGTVALVTAGAIATLRCIKKRRHHNKS